MTQDLTDAELDELAQLLEAAPPPLQALDVLMLDGYLAGTLVQPRVVAIEEWLPAILDVQQCGAPTDGDPAWLARVTALIARRHDALNADISEEGYFDPVIVDIDRLPPASEYEAVQSPISRALLPWAAGFQWAQDCFPDLEDWADDAVRAALSRIYRHLPPQDDGDKALQATLDRGLPLADLDAAIEDLVNATVELWDLTANARFAVATIRRSSPKLGRNDPCHCNSGKKFKACHGKP